MIFTMKYSRLATIFDGNQLKDQSWRAVIACRKGAFDASPECDVLFSERQCCVSIVPPAPSPATFWPCGCRVSSSGGRPGPPGGTGSDCGSLRAGESGQAVLIQSEKQVSKLHRVRIAKKNRKT